MPHFYAHRVFGDLVWNKFSPEIRQKLEPHREGYQLGLYGPDPLFFYSINQHNPAVIAGHSQHTEAPQRVLELFRGQLSQPQVPGYALGWFCHYMLDAACHPIVLAHCRNSVGHACMELALDRRLRTRHTAPPEPIYGRDAYKAAAICCPDATAEGIEKALKHFYHFSYTSASLYRQFGQPEVTTMLDRRMLSTVNECAILSVRLLHSLEQNDSLDWLPQVNFQGKPIVKAAVI